MSTDRPSHSGPRDPDIVHHRLEDVWNALDEDELDKALEIAEELHREHPDLASVGLGLAAARYENGLVRETLEAARAAGPLEDDEDDALRLWYVAASHHYLWEFADARAELDELVREQPGFAESWYLLAQVCEAQGDEVGARRGYDRAFDLEPERFPRPTRFDDASMRDAVQAARDELPERFQAVLDDVAIAIEEMPTRELAQPEGEGDPIPPDVLGLFVGANQLDRSVFSPLDHPGVIFLFQRNLERMCGDPETLIEEIRTTLWHELAHYLGFEEDQMADLGLE